MARKKPYRPPAPFRLPPGKFKIRPGSIRRRDECCDEVEKMARYLEELHQWCYDVWNRIWGDGGGGGEGPPPPPGWP